MTQIMNIETFGGEDPAVVTWREAFASAVDVIALVPETIEAVADTVGSIATKAITKLAS